MIRTDCCSGKQTIPIMIWEVKSGYDGNPWFYLKNGVTGYESCQINDELISDIIKGKDWIACTGTKDRWDRLEVFSDEIIKALQEYAMKTGNIDLWNKLYIPSKELFRSIS